MRIGGNVVLLGVPDKVLIVLAAVLGLVMTALTVGASAANQPRSVVVIGDSYTKGSGENSGKDSLWLAKVSKDLHLDSMNLAEGGAGYVHPNAGGKTFFTHVKAVPSKSDLVIVFGSLNDVEGYDAVRAAATKLYADIRKETDAPVLVVGPTWPNGQPSPAVVASRDAVRDAAASAGDDFIDPIGWLAGRPDLIGGDHLHPNNAGHSYLAGKLEPIIAAKLDQASR